MIRLDKYLADMGVGTRQEVKKHIRQGRASVDGMTVKRADLKVDESSSELRAPRTTTELQKRLHHP